MEGVNKRGHSDDLRGASKLAVEATKRVTAIVQQMHIEIASGPGWLGKPLAAPARFLTRLAYGSVQGMTDYVGTAVDVALSQLAPLLGQSAPGSERETIRAVLNGVLGDYLEQSSNVLAVQMQMRVAIPGKKMLVLVHGSGMHDRQWSRHGHDHGALLAADLGCGLAYLHYNTGLHISDNGAMLAQQIEHMAADVEELVLVGYSMGGLVARSAIIAGEKHAWMKKLSAIVTLGTPHHGAPLERGGSWIHSLIDINRYSAPIAQLARIRSAGITDLRYGNVRESDWAGRDRFEPGQDPRTPSPLPPGVAAFAIAGSRSPAKTDKPKTDGLVPVTSALGQHDNPALRLDVPAAHQLVVYACSHLDLLDHPQVYNTLRAWSLTSRGRR